MPNLSLKCWAHKIVKPDNLISKSHKLISQKLSVTENVLDFHTMAEEQRTWLLPIDQKKQKAYKENDLKHDIKIGFCDCNYTYSMKNKASLMFKIQNVLFYD